MVLDIDLPASYPVSVQQLWSALQALVAGLALVCNYIGIAGYILCAYAAGHAVCNMAMLCPTAAVLSGHHDQCYCQSASAPLLCPPCYDLCFKKVSQCKP